MLEIKVNGKTKKVDVDPEMPLLWVLREEAKLTGTKFSCGAGLCGACTVYVDGEPMRSCVLPVAKVQNKNVTTIEGANSEIVTALQEAWVAENTPQCGYCQSGQIMTAAVLLKSNPKPTDGDIDDAMSGNICRCGTYQRIRRAIHRAADKLGSQKMAEVR